MDTINVTGKNGGAGNETAVFGGGCFWCTEAVFQELKGVLSVVPGYAGGHPANPRQTPTYEEICAGKTGHAEVIKVEYDPARISYRDLLTVFFATHDPTTLNRQGADIGEQYRSVILTTSDAQEREAETFIRELNAELKDKKAVTEVRPLEKFFEAEEYHREYYKKNADAPYCQVVIAPKIERLQREFEKLLKTSEKQ